jgi:RNase_H superfamily
MPRRPREIVCVDCGQAFLTRGPREGPRATTRCKSCGMRKGGRRQRSPGTFEPMAVPSEQVFVPYQWTLCDICFKRLQVEQPGQIRHKKCGKNPTARAVPDLYANYRKTGEPPSTADIYQPESPLKQAVFDLETCQLNAAWGVVLMGHGETHGIGKGVLEWNYALKDYEGWPMKRSQDGPLVLDIVSQLSAAQIWVAHYGSRFDVPWLTTLLAKHGLPPVERKLIDPVMILRRKMLIGSNSLEAAADFFRLPYRKMHLAPDVWKAAIFDAEEEAWKLLAERCRSDVRVLSALASRIGPYIGTIDHFGSWKR